MSKPAISTGFLGTASFTLLVILLALLPMTAAAQMAGGGGGGGAEGGSDVLLLVTEAVSTPQTQRPTRRFWWSNPTSPQWSDTDRTFVAALKERGVQPMEPGGDARISRIYRRPSLSVDNAAALASILGAGRVVVGRVHYRVSDRQPTWGLVGVRAEVDLQLVDAAASEPTALRTFDPVRTIYGSGSKQALKAAREAVATTTARLLSRTLVAEAGPVGPANLQMPTIRLQGVGHGRALERIQRVVAGADEVDGVRVAWASEGLIALAIDPAGKPDRRVVDFAARVLANHQFRGMTIRKRSNPTGTGDVVFDVKLGPKFDAKRQPPTE